MGGAFQHHAERRRLMQRQLEPKQRNHRPLDGGGATSNAITEAAQLVKLRRRGGRKQVRHIENQPKRNRNRIGPFRRPTHPSEHNVAQESRAQHSQRLPTRLCRQIVSRTSFASFSASAFRLSTIVYATTVSEICILDTRRRSPLRRPHGHGYSCLFSFVDDRPCNDRAGTLIFLFFGLSTVA